MTNGDEIRPGWKWTEISDFKHPYHPEWDLIQWDLEDELILGPYEISFPVYEANPKWRYLRTKDAPGLTHLPSMVVLFLVASEPTDTEPGVIEGWEAWIDGDLVTDLMRALQGRQTI